MKSPRMRVAPQAPARPNVRFELSPQALERWNPGVQAATEDENTISVFDVIGYDPWTGDGVTSRRVAAALRTIGVDAPVTVLINSPGGDMFEGLAIYNLLREHKGDVTVKVLSLAASAASVIAMAGDTIQVARAGFLMIHNAWYVAIGNRHDMREVADWLEPFDRTMADLYAERTSLDIKEIAALMDAETWFGGSEAVERGFADSLLSSDEVTEAPQGRSERAAAQRLDLVLAKAGMPRSDRRRLLNDLKSGTPRAAGAGTRGAAEDDTLDAVVSTAGPLPRIAFSLE